MLHKRSELIILYETDDLLAVDKDIMVPVHGGEGIDENETLLSFVSEYLKTKTGLTPEFVVPVHRIDMNTRGPVLFAKNKETRDILVRAFKSGEVLKTYHMLAEGVIEKTVFIQADIIKGSHKKASVQNLAQREEGIPEKEQWLKERDRASTTISATLVRPMERFRDSTLCEVETWTGRFHQIRAVSEAIGHPLRGDMKYKKRVGADTRRSRLSGKGQMLICKKLEIKALGISVTSSFDIEKPVAGI